MNEFIRKSILLLRTTRPFAALIPPIVLLLGLYYGGGETSPIFFLQLISFFFLINIIGYGINDVYDYHQDKKNPNKKKYSFFTSKVEKKDQKFILDFIHYFAIPITILISILSGEFLNVILTILLIIGLYTYSAEPLRFKERAPLDAVVEASFFLFTFLIGYTYSQMSIFNLSPILLLSSFFTLTGFHAFSTLIDYEFDKKVGAKTFSVAFGRRFTSLYSFLTLVQFYIVLQAKNPIVLYGILSTATLFLLNSIIVNNKLIKITTIIFYFNLMITAIVFSTLFI